MAIVLSGEGYAVTQLGLVFRKRIDLHEWLELGERLAVLHQGIQWMLGDWLIYGEAASWGEQYSQALGETGLEYSTLSNYKWVAGRFNAGRRRGRLTWSHHAELASLEPAEQDKWLDAAEEGGWSVRELRFRLEGGQETPTGPPGASVDYLEARSPGAGLGAPMSPLELAKKAYAKLSPKDRRSFLDWVKEGG